ncbi:MAG: restriction endonuclease [Burkholderiales bacterium]
MKWEMHENSLFAILLRSAWWVSFAIGLAVSLVGATALPPTWRVVGVVTGLPFIVIGCIAAWRQLRAPSGKRVERTLESVRTLSWPDFAAALEEGFARDGYTVARGTGAADLELKKEWRTVLVTAKRWKVARTGIEPLRELAAAREAQEAHECLYVATGEVTDQAQRYAAANRIRFVGGAELARLLPALGRAPRAGTQPR